MLGLLVEGHIYQSLTSVARVSVYVHVCRWQASSEVETKRSIPMRSMVHMKQVYYYSLMTMHKSMHRRGFYTAPELMVAECLVPVVAVVHIHILPSSLA